MTAERPQLLCVPLLPELGRAGLSQTQRAGMSFRPSMMELILCTLSLSHSLTQSVTLRESERERKKERERHRAIVYAHAVQWAWAGSPQHSKGLGSRFVT